MTLSTYIQSLIDQDLAKIEADQEASFQAKKLAWDKNLHHIQKTHDQEISQAISNRQNIQRFQQKKAEAFSYASQILAKLAEIYRDSIPQILTSPFISRQFQEFFKDIPKTSLLSISGQYSANLQDLVKKLGFTNLELTKSIQAKDGLGKIEAKFSQGIIEINLEDILETVKQKTMPQIIKVL